MPRKKAQICEILKIMLPKGIKPTWEEALKESEQIVRLPSQKGKYVEVVDNTPPRLVVRTSGAEKEHGSWKYKEASSEHELIMGKKYLVVHDSCTGVRLTVVNEEGQTCSYSAERFL